MEEISGDDCFRVLDNKEFILFYFTASWCQPCQRVYPDIIKIIKELNTNKVLFYKIDISDDDNNRGSTSTTTSGIYPQKLNRQTPRTNTTYQSIPHTNGDSGGRYCTIKCETD